MKDLIIFLLITFPTKTSARHEDHHSNRDTTVKTKSPRTSAMAMIGNNHVHIDYGSPGVRGRNIWNGLVSYDQVWATGAHKATWIEFSKDVKINNHLIASGKYGFFTIPNKKEWILILSKDWDMHLADEYNSDDDVIRIKTKPKKNKNLIEGTSINPVHGKNNFLRNLFNNMLRHTSLIVSQIATAIILPRPDAKALGDSVQPCLACILLNFYSFRGK